MTLDTNPGMRMSYLAVATVAVVAAGCARSTPAALAEVAFRQELARLPAEFVPCLSVDGKDADKKLLDDIGKLRPDVVPGSECTYELRGELSPNVESQGDVDGRKTPVAH